MLFKKTSRLHQSGTSVQSPILNISRGDSGKKQLEQEETSSTARTWMCGQLTQFPRVGSYYSFYYGLWWTKLFGCITVLMYSLLTLPLCIFSSLQLVVGARRKCSGPEMVTWIWHLSLRALACYKHHQHFLYSCLVAAIAWSESRTAGLKSGEDRSEDLMLKVKVGWMPVHPD